MSSVWCLFYLDEKSGNYILSGVYAEKEKAEAAKHGRDIYRIECWAVLSG